jgi:hypothetical protein
MSHQPSTTDNIKNTANSAYESIANTVTPSNEKEDYEPDQDKTNFKEDVHGNTVKKGDFKDQLNDAAFGGSKEPERSYVEKGAVRAPCMLQSVDKHRG